VLLVVAVVTLILPVVVPLPRSAVLVRYLKVLGFKRYVICSNGKEMVKTGGGRRQGGKEADSTPFFEQDER
jgi:hypothetical protein